MDQTNQALFRRGTCSVAKELPRADRKTSLAERKSIRRHSHAVAAANKKTKHFKARKSGTIAIRFGPAGNQLQGAIQFHPHSITSFNPKPIKRGEPVTLVPKVKFWTPEMVAAKGTRYRSRQKVKFTREQRIFTAKELARKNKAVKQ